MALHDHRTLPQLQRTAELGSQEFYLLLMALASHLNSETPSIRINNVTDGRISGFVVTKQENTFWMAVFPELLGYL